LTCTRCKTEKPESEFQPSSLKPGIYRICRECNSTRQRDRRRNNPEVRERQRAYQKANADKVNAYNRAYRKRSQSTPESREKIRIARKDAYLRRTSTPEGLAREQAIARAKYQRLLARLGKEGMRLRNKEKYLRRAGLA
jgi:hypothetical protein